MGGPQPPAEGNASSATSPRTSSIARSTKPGHVSKLRSTFGARQSSFGAGRASARPSSAKLTAAERRAKKAAQEEAIRQHNAMILPNLEVVDEVMIPADLAPGDYVLQWRWDCEESDQIWASCADVTVVA